MKTIYLICAALVFSMLSVGCAKPPTEEMNNATEAVTRAENDIDAATYASSTIARAREALDRMQAEAASKRYDTAKSYALDAIAIAERAISEGQSGLIRARDEASALVSQLPPLIEETKQGINAARSADLPLDFDALDRDLHTAIGDAGEAQDAFSDNRYQDSIDKGRTARAELTGINQQLSNIAIATTRTK